MSIVEQSTSSRPETRSETVGPPANRRPASVLIREIIETLLLTFFIFWIVNGLVGRYRIDGNSMNPTLLNGEYLLISNFAYHLDDPQRGEIIVFRHPRSELNLIKRVIGLPGDTIQVQDGAVVVNGMTLDEPYIQAPPTYGSSWVVPEGNTSFWGTTATTPVIRTPGAFYRPTTFSVKPCSSIGLPAIGPRCRISISPPVNLLNWDKN
jgi:signal peptidase I